MSGVEYREPRSLDEACDLLARYGEDARPLAGGTALVLLMRQRLLTPACLVNLQRVDGLRRMERNGNGLQLGALVTHAEAARSPLVRDEYPALADTFARVATPRIRNVATVGGNLAHGDPHLDPPVTLLALDAAVDVASTRGTRTLPLTDLFRDYYETALAPDEVLLGVHVPVRPAGRSGQSFLKFLPRSQDDYAVVDVAVWLTLADHQEVIQDVRVALGSVGPIPFRALAAERALRGSRPDPDRLREAGEAAAAAADPEDDVRGSAAYKRELIKVLVGRAVVRAAADAAQQAATGGNNR